MSEKAIFDGLLEQISTDLEVREPEELATMKAEGERMIAEAMAQKRPLIIIHKRIGDRKKLESFLRHAQELRQLPAVRRNTLQTKISEDFMGELELWVLDADRAETEETFRRAIAERSPFFGEVTSAEVDGALVLRTSARLFELISVSEALDNLSTQ